MNSKLIRDSDYLIIRNGNKKFDVKFEYDLSNILVDETNPIPNQEDNFLTNYGIIIENPEDSLLDSEWTIVVPEKQLEGSITLL